MRAVTLAFLLGVASCTTGERVANVQAGMTIAEVENELGRPDGFQQNGDFVSYTYVNRLISGWSWDRADYSFIFENDRLIQYGPGQVRQGNGPNVGTLFLVPIQ